jgi:hypothetical protein
VVGSRLLFPDRTIQHAGVVFSLSGDPLHVYVGFPAEHPVVMRSRRFQAVTAACMLIRAEVFDQLDGFDTDYHNDLEDVDLCLRLAEAGHGEIHYCHESVLYHLESASRLYRFHEGRSQKIYRERWGARVWTDELNCYLEDGMLDLLRYSPELLRVDSRRQQEAELLQIRSRQLLALLRGTIRAASDSSPGSEANGGRRLRAPRARATGPRKSRSRRRGEQEVASLRSALAAPIAAHEAEPPPSSNEELTPRPRAEGYGGVVSEVANLIEAVVPQGATVLVVSKGDEQLVTLPGHRGWHFPRADDGRYRGYYPESDHDAIAHLDELRAVGAGFLALPGTAFWWLEHYPGFANALSERFRLVAKTDACMVFDIGERQVQAASVTEISSGDYEALVGRVKRLVETVVPPGSTVLSVSKGDDKLIDFPGRPGWHFPRADDGRYRGYHPAGDDDAISDLEALRAQGAQYLVLPATAFWWLDHYAGFAAMLDSRYARAASTESCIVFDLRAPNAGAVAPVTEPAPAATGEDATAPARVLGAAQYADLVGRVRGLVEATVPAGATVLVVSKGDDKLVDLAGRRGWHFPRAADGRYLGYYPRTDHDAIAHLEELRASGAEYLVFPGVALWWLDHYAHLATHLRERYGTVAYDHDTAIVFELGEPLAVGVIEGLLPKGSRVAVSSMFRGDLAALDGYDAVALSASTAPEAVGHLKDLIREGVEFLVIPRSAFAWHEQHFGLRDYLREHHRFVTHQRYACEIWELQPVAQRAELIEGREPASVQAEEPGAARDAEENGEANGMEAAGQPLDRHRLTGVFRLLWKRRGNRSRDV